MAAKASAKHPFLPMFVGDFMAATNEWEGEEQALYALLLMHQWALGHLPIEATKLARLVRWDNRNFERYWPAVASKFETREVSGFGPRLFNPRLEEHRAKSLAISEKRSHVGKLGAEAKWQTDGNSHAGPMANANGANGKSHDFANGKPNAIHPIPSHPIHPDPSERSHSVAEVSGAPSSAGADAPGGRASKVQPTGAPEGKGESRPKGARIPDDFALTPARSQFAQEQGVDPARTHASFCDFWRAKSGAGATKLDWDATWRNWCRKEADSQPTRRGASAADRITWRPTE